MAEPEFAIFSTALAPGPLSTIFIGDQPDDSYHLYIGIPGVKGARGSRPITIFGLPYTKRIAPVHTMKKRVKHLLWPLLVPLMALLSPLATAQTGDFDALPMNGLAAFEQLRKEYYIGALHLESLSADPAAIASMPGRKRMSIRITADRWPALRFAQQWNQSILINNSSQELNANVMDVLAFTSLPKDDLITGDRLTIDAVPNVGTRVTLNGTPMLQTRSDALFKLLVNTWIGARPSTSGFKRDMLKLPAGAAGTELLARYEALDSDAARRKLVAGWASKVEADAETAVAAAAVAPAAKPAETAKPAAAAAAAATATVATAAAQTTPAAVPTPTVAAAPAAAAAPKPAASPEPKPVAAAPVVAAAPAPTPAAAAPAVDNSAQQALYTAYSNSLRKLIYAKLNYPKRAVQKEIEGLVVLRVSSNRSGQLIAAEVAQSAHQVLDNAAQQAATKAAPFPAVAAAMGGDSFQFMIPVVFKLAD